MRILVIQPDQKCDLARFRDWIDADFIERGPHEVPENTDGADALIVLGGEMGDGDDDQYPWLQNIRNLLRVAHDANVPTLGVCLGSQLLASTFGGQVERGEHGFEVGVIEVTKVAEDPLLEGIPDTFLAGSMHQDAITRLPEGATLLATGSLYPHQAFRYGSSWGVQFHPELSPDVYERWMNEITSMSERTRERFHAGLEDFRANDEAIARANSHLAKNFMDYIARG